VIKDASAAFFRAELQFAGTDIVARVAQLDISSKVDT
jgi:hypothetical protein